MSMDHASSNTSDSSAIRERTFRTLGAIRAAHGGINRMAMAIRLRADIRCLDRFSAHTLQDIGFERDWDGAIIRRQR